MKMVNGKMVPDSEPNANPTKVLDAENGSSKAGDTFVVPPARTADGRVAEVNTDPIAIPVGGHTLDPKPTPTPSMVAEGKTGNPLNKGDMPIRGNESVAPDTINLNKNDGELKNSDRSANGAPTVVRDEFKAHPPEQVANAQARNVTALTEAKLSDAPNNDDKRYTGAQKLGLIEQALKNKGLDSMQLINAMAEIKAILNW